MNASQRKYAIQRLTEISQKRANTVIAAYREDKTKYAKLSKVTIGDFLEANPPINNLADVTEPATLEALFNISELKDKATIRFKEAMSKYDMEATSSSYHKIINPITCKGIESSYISNAIAPLIREIQNKLNNAVDDIMLGNSATEVQALIDAF